MNCQELARILDERDLDRVPAAQRSSIDAHLAACPDCTRDHDLHRRLNALRIPPLDSGKIAQWRAVALSDAGAGRRQRLRVQLIVMGTLVAVAAAAALLAVHLYDAPEQAAAAAHWQEPISPLWHPEESAVAEVGADSVQGTAADTPAGAFAVFVMPLQIESDHPAARTMGEEYFAKLLDQLRLIPGLVLVNEAGHADFRLRVSSGYGKVPERFGGHEQWHQNLVAEAASTAGAFTQVLAFSNNPDCGRISPADLANAWGCTPAGMVEMGMRQLRRNVFPPDPSAVQMLQSRFLDTSQPQGVRRQALAELIELRQRAPGSMDPNLIQVIINDAIANAPDPAQRVNLWRALRGQPGSAMVKPMIEHLRREGDDAVRLEMVSTLAAEFSADPAARAELALIANRDEKMLVRKVAERALSSDEAWRDYVVSTVKDANLPEARRFEPLAWMGDTRLMRPADGRVEADLIAVARRLFDDGAAVALAEVLASASSGATRPVSGTLQIAMSSVQHPAVADFLIATVDRQPDFSAFSLLGRHRADPRIEAKLRDMAARHPEANVRQLAAAQLQTR